MQVHITERKQMETKRAPLYSLQESLSNIEITWLCWFLGRRYWFVMTTYYTYCSNHSLVCNKCLFYQPIVHNHSRLLPPPSIPNHFFYQLIMLSFRYHVKLSIQCLWVNCFYTCDFCIDKRSFYYFIRCLMSIYASYIFLNYIFSVHIWQN